CLMARAAYCAGEQNKFWEMNDRFVYNGFSRDRNLEHSLFKVAESISLDIEDFKNCLNSERANQAVKEDIEAALKLNIRGTPSLVIDNQVHLGALPPEILSKLDANEQE
ncbi:MAG: thioredoxin domain-containing protein, partial [SAR324 cluster bacterium]|nr:thioredoxin domain-containing protein [SAR324 cluster bacterium]